MTICQSLLKFNLININEGVTLKEYHQIEDLPIALQNEIKDNASFFDNFDNKSLDEQQRIACVLNDCDLEIIAGAGTGKTHTLLAKAAYLIEKKNIAPDDILFLSFSKSQRRTGSITTCGLSPIISLTISESINP